MKSDYLRLPDEKTRCPECKGYVTLLQDRKLRKVKPMFYICWTCKEVFEVGKGIIIWC